MKSETQICIEINLNIFKLVGVRQYLHRMVVCLDSEILPFVPVAMESLMKNADAKELYDFIPLINQLVCKFKVGIHFCYKKKWLLRWS